MLRKGFNLGPLNKVVVQRRATASRYARKPGVSCSLSSDAVSASLLHSLPPSLPPSLPASLSAEPGAVLKNMRIVAKVQGFLPPTRRSHWLPLNPALWEDNTLGMNCAWLPTGRMLPLSLQRGEGRGPVGGCDQNLVWPQLCVSFFFF